MKPTFQILIICLGLLFIHSCQSVEESTIIGLKYYPTQKLLKKGIVNKYYVHSKEESSNDLSTNPDYISYKLVNDTLLVNYYKDVNSLISTQKVRLTDSTFVLQEETSHSKRFPYRVEIIDSTIVNWVDQQNSFKKLKNYDSSKRSESRIQESNADTIVLDRPAKVIKGTRNDIITNKSDTTIYSPTFVDIYVPGIGLFYSESKYEHINYWRELVEQIPLEEFLRQKDESLHKVGFIDTLLAFDSDVPLKLCKKHGSYITEYYAMGSIENYFKGGKRAIWKILEDQLDPDKLFEESGYLTFRFIVNCHGQAGKYITEQADLDFQEKTFNKQTVEHFYGIIQTMTSWNPAVMNGESYDAYYYLTFKLKDGVVIEILP